MRRPRPVTVVAAVVGVLVLGGALRSCGGVDISALPKVSGTTSSTVPTTVPPDLGAIPLPGLEGSTTTLVTPIGGGAHLLGSVVGPTGAVPGATVRVERLVADQALRTDVATGPDGRWDLPGVAGGRYRVRAFLSPTFTQERAEVFFLKGDEERQLDLQVQPFQGLGLEVAVAPDPPSLGDAVNVVVQLTNRTVDADGVGRAEPVPGTLLEIVSTGGWQLRSQNPAVTDSDGRAVFGMVCRRVGPNQIQVRLVGATDPTPVALDVAECTDPAATTTTEPASSSTTVITVPTTGSTTSTSTTEPSTTTTEQ